MNLYLVRHGETKENAQRIMQGHLPGTLTKSGLKQAKDVSDKLKGGKFDHIYSSDLQRAVDTAMIIKTNHPDIPLTFTKEAREINLGEFQGKKREEVSWDALGEDMLNRKPKGGESILELRKRAVSFIFKLYKKHKDANILVVTHRGFMRQVVAYFEKTPPDKIYEHYSIKNAAVLKLKITGDKKGKVLNLSEVLADSK